MGAIIGAVPGSASSPEGWTELSPSPDFDTLVLERRPAWVCVSKDEVLASHDGSSHRNLVLETPCAPASLLRMRSVSQGLWPCRSP